MRYTVQELIDELLKHNPKAGVTFSVEFSESEDPRERRFAEDGWQFVCGNGNSGLDRKNETIITSGVLVGSSNLSVS